MRKTSLLWMIMSSGLGVAVWPSARTLGRGEEQTNLDRIAALKEECALKKDCRLTTPIGFAA